jgi:hypothetical protein
MAIQMSRARLEELKRVRKMKVLEGQGIDCFYQLSERTMNREHLDFMIEQLKDRSWQIRQANMDFALYVCEEELNIV